MKKTKRCRWQLVMVVGLMTLGLLGGPPLTQPAQADAGHEAELRRLYDDNVEFEKLSSAGQNLLQMKFGRKAGLRVAPAPTPAPSQASEPLAPATVFVNNPAADATAQDTQSETALVAFGSTVVSAYNDSGSCLPTCATAMKFTGYSRSINGGASFTDLGTLPATANGDGGDPVLARDNVTGVLFLTTLMFSGSGIQCFRSVTSGATWAAPVNCAPGVTGFQDKPWITVDQTNGTIYVVWRDFGPGNAIKFTRSIDGGATYGPSGGLVIAGAGANNVQGPNVAVGTDLSVYVFWYDQSAGAGTNPILRVRKSIDFGASFAAAVNIASDLGTTATNGDLALSGGLRTNSFPQVAVNPVSGHLYVAYNRVFGGQDTDIRLRRSTDGGATWASVIDPGFSGSTDWSPSIAVASGSSQRIMVSWYQKPAGSTVGNVIDRLGTFVNGSTFAELGSGDFKITTAPFPIIIGQDPVINATYMGDYDQAAADSSFFYQIWGDNGGASPAHAKQPDVRFSKFYVAGPAGTNVAAVLPLSRFYTLGSGTLPTAFALIINAGSAVAANCRLAGPTSPPAGLGAFNFQTVDSSNVPSGTLNTPANIAPGAFQGFVFSFAPTAAIPAGTSLAMRFLCDNVADADEVVGVNNLFIGASAGPASDPVALLATISGDSVMRIPGSLGSQIAAAGVSNVGASALVTVSADTGGVPLPVTLLVCETNGVGACLTGFTPSVTVAHVSGTGRTYAIAAFASGPISFQPGVNRVYLRITEGGVGGPLHGATAAAICTTPNPGC